MSACMKYAMVSVSMRFLLLCMAAALSYSFVVTIFVFHLYTGYDKVCQSPSCNNISNAKWIWTVTSTGITTETTRPIMEENNTSIMNTSRMVQCPEEPPNLLGPMKVRAMVAQRVREYDIIHSHPELSVGGHWKPPYCISRFKIAVIVPYRDRKTHLNQLLSFLIPLLQRQLLDFRFIVAEQYGNALFNKGRVMNAAFEFAEKLGVDCVIFHDVDMFPENDHISYSCPDQPLHLGAYVDVLRYDLWYNYLLGGVFAIRMEHYRQINGHSNMFWGWGGEDDDIGRRVLANNMTILRLPKSYAKYTMLRHLKRRHAVFDKVMLLLNKTEERWPYDGLNYSEWSIVSMIPKPLYFHLYVDVGRVPAEWITPPRRKVS